MKKVTCTRCGAYYDSAAGKCPACGASAKPVDENTRVFRAVSDTKRPVRTAAPKSRQEKRPLVTGFAVAAVALLAALTLLLCSIGGVFDFVGKETQQMPRVVGQTEANARAMLEGLELNVEVEIDASAEAAGVVIAQSVPEGKALRAQQTVTLTVSDGSRAERVEVDDPVSETVEAPYVLGEDFDSAKQRMEGLGFHLTYGGEQHSDQPAGTILWQDPVSGALIQPGSAIRVTVSLGPEAKEYSISVTAGKGGSVSPGGRVTVPEGTRVEFVMTPDEGYVLQEVKINGESVGAAERYVFEAVDQDYSLYAVFRAAPDAPEDAPDAPEDKPPVAASPSDIRA